jgi:hypothetical protein
MEQEYKGHYVEVHCTVPHPAKESDTYDWPVPGQTTRGVGYLDDSKVPDGPLRNMILREFKEIVFAHVQKEHALGPAAKAGAKFSVVNTGTLKTNAISEPSTWANLLPQLLYQTIMANDRERQVRSLPAVLENRLD